MTLAGSLTAWSLMTCSSTRSTGQANGSGSARCSRPSCGARLKSLDGTQFREAHLRAAAALRERGDQLGALRHAMAVADLQLAAAVLADSMLPVLEFTGAQEAGAVARAWLARFGDAAVEANPEQLLQFVFPLASAGYRDAEAWLTKVNQAHPSPPPDLDAPPCPWQPTWANTPTSGCGTGLRLQLCRDAPLPAGPVTESEPDHQAERRRAR